MHVNPPAIWDKPLLCSLGRNRIVTKSPTAGTQIGLFPFYSMLARIADASPKAIRLASGTMCSIDRFSTHRDHPAILSFVVCPILRRDPALLPLLLHLHLQDPYATLQVVLFPLDRRLELVEVFLYELDLVSVERDGFLSSLSMRIRHSSRKVKHNKGRTSTWIV